MIAPALAEQDHHVTGTHGPPRWQAPCADPAGKLFGKPCRRQGRRVARLADLGRRESRSLGCRAVIAYNRPDLDKPASVGAGRAMRLETRHARVGDTGKIGHGKIDKIKHRPRRAEGHVKPDLAERGTVRRRAVPEIEPVLTHHLRIRALEGIDRLFEIADHEEGALRLLARRLEEFVAQAAQQPPLRRAGILCLVEQHVTDAVIKFPGHPLRGLAIGKHVVGQGDQIIIIEQPAPRLQPRILSLKSGANLIERRRQLPASQPGARGLNRRQRVLRRLLNRHDAGECLPNFSIRQAARGQRETRVGEQRIDQPVDMATARIRRLAKPGGDPRPALDLPVDAACLQRDGGGTKPLFIKAGDHMINHGIKVKIDIDAACVGEVAFKLL